MKYQKSNNTFFMRAVPDVPKKNNYERGFTLVEILVVITLIALLASLVAPKLFNKLGSSKAKVAKAQIEMIDAGLDAFRLDVGRYPTVEEGLSSLWQRPARLPLWDGKYLPKPITADPWGNPYIYKQPGPDGYEYDVLSLGSDAQFGGTGEATDISLWQ